MSKLDEKLHHLSDVLCYQNSLYSQLENIVDEALNTYFDEIDNLLLNPETIHLKRFTLELGAMRDDLAEIFELTLKLKQISDSQVKRVKRINS